MPYPLYETALSDLDIAVFDLETTGLYPGRHRIIQMAAVLVAGNRISETEHMWLINPGRNHLPLSDLIRDLTGISSADLEDKPEIDVALPEFGAFVGDRVIAGHNIARFDLPFIRRAENRSGVEVQSDYFIDTLKLAKKLKPDQRRYRLKDCATAYGIPYSEDELHDALVDTRLCAQVMIRQLDELAGRGIRTFEEMIDFVS